MNFDLIVIGGGSGGISAAKRASQLGAKVVLIEKDDLGGTCVNRGCVPKKWMMNASELSKIQNDAIGLGWNFEKPIFNWKTLKRNSQKNIQKLNEIYRESLYKNDVTFFKGEAIIRNANEVIIGDKKITGKSILLATGTAPWKPELEGIEHAITSDDLFELKQLPKSIIIVGGGYIALEFASILLGLGVDVSLIYRGEKVLKNIDEDLSAHLYGELAERGVKFHLNEDIQCISKIDSLLKVTTKSGNILETEEVLYATGRKANLDYVHLQNFKTDKGLVSVDSNYETSVKGVYAIGDMIGKAPLTPVAIREGRIVAEHLFAQKVSQKLDYNLIPTAIFTTPAIAYCGMNEQDALANGVEIEVYKTNFRPLKNMLTQNPSRTTMKLIVDKNSTKVLGVHMIGDDAPEIIQAASIALTFGANKAHFDDTVAIHPTTAEELVTIRTPIN